MMVDGCNKPAQVVHTLAASQVCGITWEDDASGNILEVDVAILDGVLYLGKLFVQQCLEVHGSEGAVLPRAHFTRISKKFRVEFDLPRVEGMSDIGIPQSLQYTSNVRGSVAPALVRAGPGEDTRVEGIWFISLKNNRHLDPVAPPIGKIISGMDNLDRLVNVTLVDRYSLFRNILHVLSVL